MERNQVTDLTNLTLADARDGLKAKRFSSAELTRAHVGAIEKARALNAFVLETPERALEMAQASDARLAKGEAGALEGAAARHQGPVLHQGRSQTTAGSNILEGFEPPYESTVTQQLWRDGAVMLGKLNNDEFAMGSSNETSAFGPVVSPWRRRGSNVHACRGLRGDRGRPSRARRLVGRVGGGGRGAALPRRDRDRHRRLDPPARRLHRHRRHQADLRPLLALGHRRLRLLARPGRPDRPHRARLRHPARRDGRPRSEGHHLGRDRRAGFRGRGRRAASRA